MRSYIEYLNSTSCEIQINFFFCQMFIILIEREVRDLTVGVMGFFPMETPGAKFEWQTMRGTQFFRDKQTRQHKNNEKGYLSIKTWIKTSRRRVLACVRWQINNAMITAIINLVTLVFDYTKVDLAYHPMVFNIPKHIYVCIICLLIH